MKEAADLSARAAALLAYIERQPCRLCRLAEVERTMDNYADLCVAVECSMAERTLVRPGRGRR